MSFLSDKSRKLSEELELDGLKFSKEVFYFIKPPLANFEN